MKQFVWSLLFFALRLSALLVLPFVLLIRGSVYFYEQQAWHTWLALAAGVAMTFLVLLLYFVFLYGSVFGMQKISRRSMKTKAWVAALLILVYCGYTLISFSDANAKSREVKEEFTSLHPFLRLSVGTLLFLDSGLLITDMSRTHADYQKMGMKTKRNSLHYPQKDGYVHAMDLRTQYRSGVRNWLLERYFRGMGFRTLRHGGTADHLHVSLVVRENPAAI